MIYLPCTSDADPRFCSIHQHGKHALHIEKHILRCRATFGASRALQPLIYPFSRAQLRKDILYVVEQ